MLELGKNSYISVEESTEIISNYFGDAYLNFWDSLTSNQKELELVKSTKKIDSLLFVGYKKYENQYLQFPRVHNIKEKIKQEDLLLEYDLNVKLAVIDNMVSFFNIEENKKNLLVKKGIKKFKLENFEETYSDNIEKIKNVCSDNTYIYLSEWINGTFEVL